MEELQISRGNASMNLRALMDWELFTKNTKQANVGVLLSRKDLDELAVK
jgi:DNA-binding transcriptional regulator GbsR (MarR family)